MTIATPGLPFPAAPIALALRRGVRGGPTPQKAAEGLIEHVVVPGYGDASSVWVEVGRDFSGVTLTAGTVRLHPCRLPDRTWVIDSGERCGS